MAVETPARDHAVLVAKEVGRELDGAAPKLQVVNLGAMPGPGSPADGLHPTPPRADDSLHKAVHRMSTSELSCRDDPTDSTSLAKRFGDVRKLIVALKEAGGGSMLRGWRSELDPEGRLEVNYQDFCAACVRMRLPADVQSLMSADDECNTLTLTELVPTVAVFLDSFKAFVKKSFQGPKELFAAMDTSGAERIECVTFVAALKRLGFTGVDFDLAELFNMCDVDNMDSIGWEDMAFLETDPRLREVQNLTIRRGRRERHRRLWAAEYQRAVERCVTPLARDAPRAWLAPTFEALPTVVFRRNVEWRKEVQRQRAGAKADFLEHLRKNFGNEVRAWRLALDPKSTWRLSKATVSNYCRKVQLNINFLHLWQELDRDSDGYLAMEELCPLFAEVLGGFQRWAREEYGSCVAIWGQPEVGRARSAVAQNGAWASDKRMLCKQYSKALKALGWPGASDTRCRTRLLDALDLHRSGVISRGDLEWLDGWTGASWLSSKTNVAAWEELRKLMLRECGTMLRAWRCLLDRDDSNTILWSEFQRCCDQLNWYGDRSGAWRALDVDLSGYISMQEFDEQGAKLLKSFRRWCEEHYGSVRAAFKAFDTDGTGQITFVQIKRTCQKMQWRGDVRSVFEFLEHEQRSNTDDEEKLGRKTLSLDAANFLDSWNVDEEDEEPETPEGTGASQCATPSTSSAPDRRKAPWSPGLPRATSAPGSLRVSRTVANDIASSSSRPSTAPGAEPVGLAAAAKGSSVAWAVTSSMLAAAPTKTRSRNPCSPSHRGGTRSLSNGVLVRGAGVRLCDPPSSLAAKRAACSATFAAAVAAAARFGAAAAGVEGWDPRSIAGSAGEGCRATKASRPASWITGPPFVQVPMKT